MDYGRLNRKELQALCKEHGIPANKTNVFMAEALFLLNAPMESEQTLESIPDPAEVFKSKETMKRATKSKNVADVLEASEVDDLSSQLAKSTLIADSEDLMVEPAAMPGNFTAPPVSKLHKFHFDESLPEGLRKPEIVAEPAKVPRKARTQSAKASTKALSSLVDSAPALVEPTLEVVLVLPVEKTFQISPATADSRTYARRVPKVTEEDRNAAIHECVADSLELGSANPDNVLATEEDTIPAGILSPVAEIVEEEIAAAAKSKKPKAKGKKGKVKIVVDILEDAIPPPTTDNMPATTALEMPESPTLGLTSDMITTREVQRAAASVSPTPGDEAGFEFHPVPESFAEIMTPGKPLVKAANGCQHRIGRKSGKGCRSCASEKKVASMLQDVLQAIEVPKVDDLAPVEEAEIEEVHTTPVKQDDDKENALKNLDLNSLSNRKLEKEIKRKGLSKRNNRKVKA